MTDDQSRWVGVGQTVAYS